MYEFCSFQRQPIPNPWLIGWTTYIGAKERAKTATPRAAGELGHTAASYSHHHKAGSKSQATHKPHGYKGRGVLLRCRLNLETCCTIRHNVPFSNKLQTRSKDLGAHNRACKLILVQLPANQTNQTGHGHWGCRGCWERY